MNSGLSATTCAAELSDDHIVALINVGVDRALSRTEQHANSKQRRTLCSILIVSFNTKDLTRACLLSLREWHADSEVIVVDNASRDGSADMIEQEFPEVRLLRLSHNIGFGRANNLAMKFSSHEVIVLLNSDTILQDNALSRCAEFLLQDKSLAGVTPRLIGVDGIEQNTRHAVPTFRQTFDRFVFGRPMVSNGGDFWIPGTCMLLKRSAVEASGGLFEPKLFIYWEDADLCSRLKEHGYRLDVVDDATIIHYGGASGGGPNCSAKPGLHEWYTFGRHYWFARHRSLPESVGLWALEFLDAFRCMGRGIVRPSRRNEFQFGLTLLKTLTRKLIGLSPTFAQSDLKGRTDEQLIQPNRRASTPLIDANLTDVGIVAIGRNEGERLKTCLRSLVRTNAPVVYVDSGSTDGSQQFAREIGAVVVELDLSKPFTAARARNEGLKALTSQNPDLKFVQFVDGDCEMTDGWFTAAKTEISRDERCAVVCGSLSERHPEASIYNRLCQLEWRRPVGKLESCGGIFLGRIAAINQANGFDAGLIAGEEPELCFRLRDSGWNIRGIASVMAQHDAAMSRFGQWWKRSVRAGHSYAEGYAMHGQTKERYRRKEVRSNLTWGFVIPLLSFVLAWPTFGLSLLIMSLGYLRLWLKIRKGRIQQGDSSQDASLYAAFVVLGKPAQAQGVLKFALNRWRGISSRIIEYK